jgi:uncharacterized protein YkwD
MGEVNMDGMVLDVNDEIVGYVDFGKGTLKSRSGSHFATVQSDGTILDKGECVRGTLKNFTYHKLKIFASYVFFFDGRLIEDVLTTKLTSEGSEVGVDSSSIGTFSEGDSLSKEEARLLKHVKHAATSAGPKPVASAVTKPVAASATPVAVAKPAAAAAAAVVKQQEVQTKPATSTASAGHSGPAVEVPKAASNPNEVMDERGLVQDADEKARREAERMNKMMGGLSVAPSSSKPKVSQHDLMASQYPIPVRPEVKSKYEVELWTEINRARTSPAELIKALEALKPNFDGKSYNFPGTHTTRITQEGVSAVDNALTFLKAQKSISPIALSDGLSLSSKDLVSLAASSKQFNNLETDEQGAARFNRYGKWAGKLFQNMALGNLSPAEVVLSWIIDDGNASREHRESIFNVDVNFVGISSGPHIELGRTTVACFTSKYVEESGAAGPSSAASSSSAPSSSHSSSENDGIAVVSAESEYKVGPLTDSGEKYFLDISNLGCPASAITVKLLDNGKSVSMTRVIRVNGLVKEAVQRMKLPFQLVAHQVSSIFASTTGILTLNFSKPNATGSTQAMKVGEFEVPAWPGNTNDKVAVQATSSGDAYVFICEPSKYLTKVAVSIDAEKKLTFDMQYTFETVVEGQPATKTVKMSSQFGLPFEVAAEQISVSSNGDKGSQVKVLKNKPSAGAINQPDTVIPIQVQ